LNGGRRGGGDSICGDSGGGDSGDDSCASRSDDSPIGRRVRRSRREAKAAAESAAWQEGRVQPVLLQGLGSVVGHEPAGEQGLRGLDGGVEHEPEGPVERDGSAEPASMTLCTGGPAAQPPRKLNLPLPSRHCSLDVLPGSGASDGPLTLPHAPGGGDVLLTMSHGSGDGKGPRTLPPEPSVDGPLTPFIDLSVYTRNRCFRLYKSSKLGKKEELTPAWLSPTELAFLPHRDETELFLASLVTNVPEGAVLLTCGEGAAEPPATSERQEGSGCPTEATGGPTLPALPPCRLAGPSAVTPASIAPCPLALLEAFMLSAWSCKTGLPAATRAWALDATRRTLSLSLAPSNRWCSHLGRPHRSNGTLLFAVLAPPAGEAAFFTQRCFDADCRAAGFRGGDRLPLPEHVVACSRGLDGRGGWGGGRSERSDGSCLDDGGSCGSGEGGNDALRLGCTGGGHCLGYTFGGPCASAGLPVSSGEGWAGNVAAPRAIDTAAKRQRALLLPGEQREDGCTLPSLGEVREGGLPLALTLAARANEQTSGGAWLDTAGKLHAELACWEGHARAEDWWDEEAERAVAGAAQEFAWRQEQARQRGSC
jgi:hypothetical protein